MNDATADRLATAIERLAITLERQHRFQELLWLALPAKTRAKLLGIGKDRERTLRRQMEAERQLS